MRFWVSQCTKQEKQRQGKNHKENSFVITKFVTNKKQKRAINQSTKLSGQRIIKQILSFIDKRIIYRTTMIYFK